MRGEWFATRLQALRVLPVVVLDHPSSAVDAAAALLSGGSSCIEITLRTEGALEAIAAVAHAFPDMLVGAGTAPFDDLGRGVRLAPEATAGGSRLVLDLLPFGSAAVRVGNAVGRGDWRSAQHAGWIAVILAGAVMAVVGVLTAAFADQAASLFTNDPAVLAALVPVLAAVVSLLVVVDSLQGVLMGALRGCADTLLPTIIYGVSFWLIGVPAAYWWGYREGIGPHALTWALLAALTAATAALALRFQHLTDHQAVSKPR